MNERNDITYWSRVICNPINHTEKAVLMIVGMSHITGEAYNDAKSKWIPKSCVKMIEDCYYVKDDFINQFFEFTITKFVR